MSSAVVQITTLLVSSLGDLELVISLSLSYLTGFLWRYNGGSYVLCHPLLRKNRGINRDLQPEQSAAGGEALGEEAGVLAAVIPMTESPFRRTPRHFT